jgi:hypothetical protein
MFHFWLKRLQRESGVLSVMLKRTDCNMTDNTAGFLKYRMLPKDGLSKT